MAQTIVVRRLREPASGARLLLLVIVAAAAHPQQIEPTPQFLGWRGETPILEIANSVVNYWSLARETKLQRLKTSKIPANLQSGQVLVADYVPVKENAIVLDVEADRAEAKAMDRALELASERPARQDIRFPDVHLTLKIRLGGKLIWTRRRVFNASPGEAGYEYSTPKLRFAVLSPSRSSLLIELNGSSGSQFNLIRTKAAGSSYAEILSPKK